MKQAINISSSKSKVSSIAVFITFFSLITISGLIFYQLFPKSDNFAFGTFNSAPKVYILESQENGLYLSSNNLSTQSYKNNLQKIQQKLLKAGISAKIITEHDITSLKPNDILIAFDDYYVSQTVLNRIKAFMAKGGNFIFNYHFGYMFNDLFVKGQTISQITSLEYLGDSISKSKAHFYVTKILSPVNFGKNAQREDLVLYGMDKLPLFRSSKTPDAILTNWEITAPPVLNDHILPLNDAGVMWHGMYKKGKWFYFSFPGYVLLDMPSRVFSTIFQNLKEYMTAPVSYAMYPFLDTKNAVFISEDTEYKYTNMINFASTAEKHNIPVTLFCVARLAQKYPKLTKKAADMKNIEIGSHSYSHTKIMGTSLEKIKKEILGSKLVLEEITGKKIYGFRPPREEIDKNMENMLRKAKYMYVMEKTKPYMLPKEEYKDIITIPRHGTDDYTYLINLDWDKKQILEKIIQEANMLTSLNALYTLSVHTHLLSYKTNLGVSDKFFKYLNEHKNITPLNGVDIARRAILKEHIKLSSQNLIDKTFLYIQNNNPVAVKNFTVRIYWPNIKKISIEPEYSSVKIKIIKTDPEMKYTDVQVKRLDPKSKISLIIQYHND